MRKPKQIYICNRTLEYVQGMFNQTMHAYCNVKTDCMEYNKGKCGATKEPCETITYVLKEEV